jgi:hypothetical protein
MLSKSQPPSFQDQVLILQSAVCNWDGVYRVATTVQYPIPIDKVVKSLEPYTVNGEEKGSFKTRDKVSFLRVYEAGHSVMADRKYMPRR